MPNFKNHLEKIKFTGENLTEVMKVVAQTDKWIDLRVIKYTSKYKFIVIITVSPGKDIDLVPNDFLVVEFDKTLKAYSNIQMVALMKENRVEHI